MKRYIPALDPIPSGIPYYDGKRYRCYEDRCIITNAPVAECGQIPLSEEAYIPILRCECCGHLYFGVDTWKHKEETPPPPPPVKKPEQPKPAVQDTGIILPNLLTV